MAQWLLKKKCMQASQLEFKLHNPHKGRRREPATFFNSPPDIHTHQ